MSNLASTDKRLRLGAYSRSIERGAIGKISGKTADGKFLRHVERELVAHVGGSPSFPQMILIRRAARKLLQLEALDAKLRSGGWTDHDSRTLGGLNNSLRLDLRELGIKAAPKDKGPTIADIAARYRDDA